jgi:hypothetical protein
MSHVQHFLKTDYTEYSVQPNIRFEPNNCFPRIFVKTDYSAEYSFSENLKNKFIIFTLKLRLVIGTIVNSIR